MDLKKHHYLPVVICVLYIAGCATNDKQYAPISLISENTNPLSAKDSVLKKYESAIGSLEQSMINAGLVNIKEVDSSIVVQLKYSSTDNFMGTDVYGNLENCYLQKEVAAKLVLAQMLLKSKFPYYSLIVYDGARPRKVQQVMWDIVKVAPGEKTKYLSSPLFGSLHNFGAAVDLSIVDAEGREIDMGTKFDYFGELAYPEKEEQMLKEGRLSGKQVENRKLLRNCMIQAGFSPLETEWWHFNSCSRSTAAEQYQMIE